ncbi:hypothetical protein RCO28_23185 [Streptomyces sp. LHD-70]|uniref:hypothetical protein n=1 Tax=Streptomyces sp. LHD-70 TaxID=3072140 RepID=UPI00280DEE7F|nr:hypothetical protein [Streptomyces sp. LHD-70]MDQ8705377.1 hypothetical protein [Streptomyces sp. LHD-70]
MHDGEAERPDAVRWEPVPPAAVAAAERLTHRVDVLARQVVDVYATAVLPDPSKHPEELDLEVAAAARHFLRGFALALAERRAPSARELELFRENAARRAEEGMDLRTVLWGQQVLARTAWQALVQELETSAPATLETVGDRLFRYWFALVDAATTGYLEGRHPEQEPRTREVTAALLAGRPAQSLADIHGIRLTKAHVVLALRFADHPQELLGGETDRLAAGTRKLRRVLLRLARQLGEPPLARLDPSGGVVLIPRAAPDAGMPPDLSDRVAELCAAAGAGAAHSHTRAVPRDPRPVTMSPNFRYQAGRISSVPHPPGEVSSPRGRSASLTPGAAPLLIGHHELPRRRHPTRLDRRLRPTPPRPPAAHRPVRVRAIGYDQDKREQGDSLA